MVQDFVHQPLAFLLFFFGEVPCAFLLVHIMQSHSGSLLKIEH